MGRILKNPNRNAQFCMFHCWSECSFIEFLLPGVAVNRHTGEEKLKVLICNPSAIQKKETEVSLRFTNFVLQYDKTFNLGAKVRNLPWKKKRMERNPHRPGDRSPSVESISKCKVIQDSRKRLS
ncbi:MAG: hypothetical protein NC252_00540, partial [Roseburia sp.]|nr:hypothetical protein [Roseburia sp.]